MYLAKRYGNILVFLSPVGRGEGVGDSSLVSVFDSYHINDFFDLGGLADSNDCLF
jgi:hypothetical protein